MAEWCQNLIYISKSDNSVKRIAFQIVAPFYTQIKVIIF